MKESKKVKIFKTVKNLKLKKYIQTNFKYTFYVKQSQGPLDLKPRFNIIYMWSKTLTGYRKGTVGLRRPSVLFLGLQSEGVHPSPTFKDGTRRTQRGLRGRKCLCTTPVAVSRSGPFRSAQEVEFSVRRRTQSFSSGPLHGVSS